MRIEKLGTLEQIQALERLHRRINRDFFENGLDRVKIDIQNINNFRKPTAEIALACFLAKDPYTGVPCKKILFSHELMDDIAQAKTQKEQVYIASSILLHEMVHQFCFENGMPYKGHADGWEETAKAHHLISKYDNGKLIEDYPDDIATMTFYAWYTRWR